MTTREVLVEARRILTPDGAWTQEHEARNALGGECDYDDEAAVCWCVDGALSLAATDSDGNRAAAYDGAWYALPVPADSDSPVAWNDAPGRTQAEVLELLDRAIKEAE